MNSKWKELVVFLKDWRDYMNGLIPASYAELDWSGNENDTPIYDQLEREWAEQGRIGPSND